MRKTREILLELKRAREYVTDLERELRDSTTIKTYEVEFLHKIVTRTDIASYTEEEAYLIAKKMSPNTTILSIELKKGVKAVK